MGTPNRQRMAYSVRPSWAEAGGRWWHPAPPGAAKRRDFPGAGGFTDAPGAVWVGLCVGVGVFMVRGASAWGPEGGAASGHWCQARRGPRSATAPHLAPDNFVCEM